MITITNFVFEFSLLLIIAFYLVFIIRGMKVGFVTTIINLLSSIISLIASIILAKNIASSFNFVSVATIEDPSISRLFNIVLWGIAVFFLIKLLLMLLKILLNKTVDLPVLKQVNNLLGGFIGFINATLILLIITVALQTPLFTNGNDLVENSSLKVLTETSQKIYDFFLDEDGIQKMDVYFNAIKNEAKDITE